MPRSIMLLGALLFASASSAPASAETIGMSDAEQVAPATPAILPMRERAAVIDVLLAERLHTVIPSIMREQGIDMWLLMSREYFEEQIGRASCRERV